MGDNGRAGLETEPTGNNSHLLSDHEMTESAHRARDLWRRRVSRNPKLAALVDRAKAGDDAALLAFVEAARAVKGGAQ